VGYCEALKDTSDIELAHNYGDVIHKESDLLLALINDLLDMAKIEAGKMIIPAAPFNIRSLVKETLRGQMVMAQKKGLSFTWSVDGTIPEFLSGDSLRIRQVLLNLTSNAVKFTESGTVDVKVTGKDMKEDSLLLECSVRDTGMGIPEDKMHLIFESFSQVDPYITRRFGGTGLGLSIAAQLVELMGGTLSVNSREGKGSIFCFTIPLKECKLTKEEMEALNEDIMNFADRNLLGSGHILLVDDYPTWRLWNYSFKTPGILLRTLITDPPRCICVNIKPLTAFSWISRYPDSTVTKQPAA